MAVKKADKDVNETAQATSTYFLPEELVSVEATSVEDAHAKAKKLKGNK